MNIWYFFTCFCLDLLKSNGLLCFIAPNNWNTASGASIMRNKILEETKILDYMDFGNYHVFERADQQAMIFILWKNRQHNDEYLLNYTKISDDSINKQQLVQFLNKTPKLPFAETYETLVNKTALKDKLLTFTNYTNEKLFIKIAKGKIFLQESEISNGINFPHDKVSKKMLNILGSNHSVGDGIFVLSNKELNNIEKKDRILIKPFYTSEKLHRYFADTNNDQWIIYTSSKFKNPIEIMNYPTIKKHLDKYISVITSDNKPYGLHRARNESFFKGSKIISLRKCSNCPTFTYTDFDCYVGAMYNIIKPSNINLKYLVALLNSKLIEFWLRNKGKMQGNNYQIDKEPLLNIPIYKPTAKEETKISNITEKILKLMSSKDYCKNLSKQQAVKQYEEEIDNIVYDLYGLTEEEKLLIDPDRLLSLKFQHKPSSREIVGKIASAKPSLMDNDRAFCYLFDKIALNNGWQKFELPSYWTIGRTIYNYKKDNNIKASVSAPTKSELVNKVDLNNPMLKTYKFEIPKPSIKQIIAKIAEYDDYLFDNDRKLVELFDGIALTNGYNETELPKYWNIIRAMFDYKKESKGE